MTIEFGSRKIGKGQPVFIIAEIGINHEGDYETCAEMVRKSAEAGADAIKLQTVDADENYVEGHLSWRLFRTCALTNEETIKIFELTRELGMEPFTTSPDLHTLKWVDQDGRAPGHKISSGMMTNDLIVRKTCETGKPVLISTGVASADQIDHVVEIAKATGNQNIALFQCTSQYPVELDKVNLNTMAWMTERYDVPVGFSDHSKGISAAMVATSLGAVMIEKHVTLTPGRKAEIDGEFYDFDHHIGIDFDEFAEMVKGIRRAEKMTFDEVAKEIPEAHSMLGDYERVLSYDLAKVAAGLSRCLVARRPIKAGDILTEDNVGLKRPFPDNRGMEPYMYEKVLGCAASNDLNIDDPIREYDIENQEKVKVS